MAAMSEERNSFSGTTIPRSSSSANRASNDDEMTFKWKARMNCGKTILRLLKMINDVHEMAIISIGESGIRVTVEKHKTVQGSVFLDKEFFDSFHLNSGDISFKIDLKMLIDCIGIFGYHHMNHNDHINQGIQALQLAATTSRSQLNAILDQMIPFKLKLAYRDDGFPFSLVVDEHDADSVCDLETYPSDTLFVFTMIPEETVVEVLISSEFLYELLAELDFSSDFIRISFYKETQLMKISTKSSLGDSSTRVDHMDDHDDVSSSKITENQKNVYKLSLFKLAMKSMETAEFTAIRVSHQGLLCISSQIVIEVAAGDDKAYVEYYILPSLPDEW